MGEERGTEIRHKRGVERRKLKKRQSADTGASIGGRVGRGG